MKRFMVGLLIAMMSVSGYCSVVPLNCDDELGGVGNDFAGGVNDDRGDILLAWGSRGGGISIDWSEVDLSEWYINWIYPGNSTVGNSLALLTRKMDVDPKMFVCPSNPEGEVPTFDPLLVRVPFDLPFERPVDPFLSDENPWGRSLESTSSVYLVPPIQNVPVPEPGVMVLLAIGGVTVLRRRRG